MIQGVHSFHSYSKLCLLFTQKNKTRERIERDISRKGRNQVVSAGT
jgi:hypothetical protein